MKHRARHRSAKRLVVLLLVGLFASGVAASAEDAQQAQDTTEEKKLVSLTKIAPR